MAPTIVGWLSPPICMYMYVVSIPTLFPLGEQSMKIAHFVPPLNFHHFLGGMVAGGDPTLFLDPTYVLFLYNYILFVCVRAV
jgi:hypothetical protein